MHTSARGTLLIATLALVWGSNFLWIKIALESFSPLQLTMGRMILGALVLMAVIVVRRERLPRGLPTWGHLLVAAIVANVAPYLLFALGETRVDSSIAGALNATTPLWTLILAFTIRQSNRLTALQIGGLVIGFLGSILVFTPWDAESVDTIGALYCLVAALSYGISYVYMGRYLTSQNLTPTVLSAAQLIAASVLIAAMLPMDAVGVSFVGLSSSWIALVVLGVIGTGLAYVINYALIHNDGAVGASVVAYLVPIASALFGFLILNERIPLPAFVGIALILIGVSTTRRPQRARGPARRC